MGRMIFIICLACIVHYQANAIHPNNYRFYRYQYGFDGYQAYLWSAQHLNAIKKNAVVLMEEKIRDGGKSKYYYSDGLPVKILSLIIDKKGKEHIINETQYSYDL